MWNRRRWGEKKLKILQRIEIQRYSDLSSSFLNFPTYPYTCISRAHVFFFFCLFNSFFFLQFLFPSIRPFLFLGLFHSPSFCHSEYALRWFPWGTPEWEPHSPSRGTANMIKIWLLVIKIILFCFKIVMRLLSVSHKVVSNLKQQQIFAFHPWWWLLCLPSILPASNTWIC